ncbi:hypothetical protein [Agromyces sp. Soil535]|uniref:hypothetical protein n=1 Tax=Agromyces sp. Soil535 TaxID=1736390 RepID=UPI0006F36CF8|nr:hypothetical protein [Agromyces sp. Soil535]KRE31293.1 hypothetical protein ASG80_02255 [Agromyces sp. Soil535]
MDQAPNDERMRRLQLLAYGVGASDAERAAAIAELELIRRERAAGEAERERTDAAGAPTTPAMRPDGEASDTAAAKPLKWAIAAGTAALLIGVAVGWQVGARTAVPEPSTVAVSAAPELDASVIPIADTAVSRLYEAEPTPADVPTAAYPRDSIAPTEYRLLLTRPDGVSLRIARLHGGAEVCAVVTLPSEFTASSCTHNGMFPEGGLWVEVSLPGDEGLVRGTILPDGTAELTPRQYAGDVLPIAGN